jgi:hypothetical protein
MSEILRENESNLEEENRGKTKTHRPAGFSHSGEAKLKRLRQKLTGASADAPLNESERTELNRLRMENALLKKLQALARK